MSKISVKYLDFGKLKRKPIVAQLSKLANYHPSAENQDRILGYIPIYQSQSIIPELSGNG